LLLALCAKARQGPVVRSPARLPLTAAAHVLVPTSMCSDDAAASATGPHTDLVCAAAANVRSCVGK
jgi:hypothetical protein